ncbi:hypothetical protein GCM10007877_16370 [Marinibactrum halimedae]|uniref:Uncharacterized protein n=1 Tax=Marinibactrum halimedae TaxID=1444977 RepID=A0AA37T7C2_9GAMM|nr:hypothetical protein GCM10007877_16370 [Marinibactrum halimedae]
MTRFVSMGMPVEDECSTVLVNSIGQCLVELSSPGSLLHDLIYKSFLGQIILE